MRYGFVDGGFAVVSDTHKRAAFAYASSPHWVAAKRDVHGTAVKMLETELAIADNHFTLEHYNRLSPMLHGHVPE